MKALIHIAAAFALVLAFAPVQGRAQIQVDDLVRAELLPGWQLPDGTRMAGLRLTLAPGWKTYWRAPGDAGIPPQFNWSGSRNLAAVQVHWPRPMVQVSNGFRTVGYRNEVILPLTLQPQKPGRDISLTAQLNLGVCEEVCVPVEVTVKAALNGKGSVDTRIQTALDNRPVSAAAAGVEKVTCDVAPIRDGLRLTTRIHLPRQGRNEVVLIEAGDAGIWVSQPESIRSGNVLSVVTDLVPPSAQPFALARDAVRYTVVAGAKAVDILGCTAE